MKCSFCPEGTAPDGRTLIYAPQSGSYICFACVVACMELVVKAAEAQLRAEGETEKK